MSIGKMLNSIEKDETELARYFDGNGKFVPMFLAEELMKEYSFVTMRDNQQIYFYEDGCYRPNAEAQIKAECRKRLQHEYRMNRVSEVVDFIKASSFIERREESPNFVPFDNGILDVTTMELKPHSSEYMFFNKLPVKYNPEADCPKIKKFLGEITNSEEDVNLLLETMAYCLYRDYPFAKALMLVGGGANGKSTYLGLVKLFLGAENVCGRSLQDLEEHRFAKADLHHKLANIYSDLPDKALYRTGTFKMLTGRDLISAEKKFQNTFHYVNYAKLLFSCNKVPEAYDDTEAFFRRWIIVTFPNRFVGANCDPYILSKLTIEEELSGLLNLVLQALKRLLECGSFSYSKTADEVREDYTRKSSPIAAFIMDCLTVDSDAFIAKKELYAVFAAYCRQKSLPIVTETTFFKNLPQHMAIIDFRPKFGQDRLHTFKGVRYGEGVSSVSSVSRVFFILSSRGKDFEDPKDPWKVTQIPDDPHYIKIEITLDTLDRVDTNQQKLFNCHISFKEIYEAFRNTLKEAFYQQKALDLIIRLRNCDLKEAERIFQTFVDEGKVFRDPNGLWRFS